MWSMVGGGIAISGGGGMHHMAGGGGGVMRHAVGGGVEGFIPRGEMQTGLYLFSFFFNFFHFSL